MMSWMRTHMYEYQNTISCGNGRRNSVTRDLNISSATSRRKLRWSANKGRALFYCTWHASTPSIAKGER
jgi:hypothetical protein